MKLFKLIFMVRFINIAEQICSIEEGATSRLVPTKADKDARKINKDYHKVYNSSDLLLNVNLFKQLHYNNFVHYGFIV